MALTVDGSRPPQLPASAAASTPAPAKVVPAPVDTLEKTAPVYRDPYAPVPGEAVTFTIGGLILGGVVGLIAGLWGDVPGPLLALATGGASLAGGYMGLSAAQPLSRPRRSIVDKEYGP